jgi:hypothetical protein
VRRTVVAAGAPTRVPAIDFCACLTVYVLFTTREQATCILLIAGVLALVVVPNLRRPLGNVLLALAAPKLAVPLMIFTAYLVAAVVLALRINLWAPDLTGATLLWYLLTGFSLFMSSTDAGKSAHFFRRRVREAVSIATFFEFFNNLHTFSVPVEIVLQVALIFVGLLRAVSATKDEYRQVDTFLTGVVTLAGFALLAVTTYHLIDDWDGLDRAALGRLLILPLWLTLVSLVAVYAFALYSEYELAFLRVYFANGSTTPPRRATVALVAGLRGRLRLIHGFTGTWPHALVDCQTVRSSISAVNRYREAAIAMPEKDSDAQLD